MKSFTTILLLFVLPLAAMAMTSAFTYQGRLVQAGAAPTGSFDFQFDLYDAETDGNQVGSTVTASGVAVANGLFTVSLNFGVTPFTGADRWLAIAVRGAGGGSYTPLTPRQPLTPTPYALFAAAVDWDGILNRPADFGVYTAGTGLTLSGNEFSVNYGTNATTAARGDHTHAFNTLTSVPSGLADGDDNTTYQAGNGLYLNGTAFHVNFAGSGSAVTVSRSDHTQHWTTLFGLPSGFADNMDNDTTYTAGAGLTLSGTQFAVIYSGTGGANAVAHSDHNHDTTYFRQGGNSFGANGRLGTNDNYALELEVNNVRALRLEPQTASPNVILGSSLNSVAGSSVGSAIGGGGTNGSINTITSGDYSVVAGGSNNVIDGSYSVISGGTSNATSGGNYNVVGGGSSNTVNGLYSTASGGNSHTLNGNYGTIGGGIGNTVSGNYGTIPGGIYNTASDFCFAAGRMARAVTTGAFVWADSQASTFSSFADNQFFVRAQGGIWFGATSTPSMPAGRFINTSSGGYLSTGGSWVNASDRKLKTGFAAFDRSDLLAKLAALPITSWRYRNGEGEARHLGPTAQDFRAAFGLGLDDVSISTVDGIGVALAAVQALQAELAQVKAENAILNAKAAEVDAVKARLAALETLVRELKDERVR